MTIYIVTLFPDFFTGSLQSSIIGRAIEQEKVSVVVINIREYAQDKHRVTDDRPFGGGPGMVLKVAPIDRAVSALTLSAHKRVVLLSAKGSAFTQQKAVSYADLDDLVLICGHYEGVDERVALHVADEELRIGEYVLTGGEPAALVVADAVTRLLPGVLGNEASNQGESHAQPGVLAAPQYTRPAEYKGWQVPEVLLTGHHAQIAQWKSEHNS